MRHRRGRLRVAEASLITFVLWATSVAAQTPSGNQFSPSAPAEQQNRTPGQTGTGAPPQAPSPAAPTGLWVRSNLFGDMAGLRPLLGDDGISFGLAETDEVLGNVTGGVHRGADYDGLTEISLGIDTSKAFGRKSGIFNVSVLQIRGRDLSTDNLYTLQLASGIEANRATRLWELWYQRAFLNGKLDVKLGQQSIDQEFITSQGSSLFINTVMGRPALPSLDLYAGGRAYPLSWLGVRFRGQPTDTITVLGGVFDDNPPGGPFNDDFQLRQRERFGAQFNLRTGALFIAEVQYALNTMRRDMVCSPRECGSAASRRPDLCAFDRGEGDEGRIVAHARAGRGRTAAEFHIPRQQRAPGVSLGFRPPARWEGDLSDVRRLARGAMQASLAGHTSRGAQTGAALTSTPDCAGSGPISKHRTRSTTAVRRRSETKPVTEARQLVDAIRAELSGLERLMQDHPYLRTLEAKQASMDNLKAFAGEQYNVIRSDLRSAALMVSRFGAAPSGTLPRMILEGEAQALSLLLDFAKALGLSEDQLRAYEPQPELRGKLGDGQLIRRRSVLAPQ